MYIAGQNLEILERERDWFLEKIILVYNIIINLRNIAEEGYSCVGVHFLTPHIGPKYWLHGTWAGGPKSIWFLGCVARFPYLSLLPLCQEDVCMQVNRIVVMGGGRGAEN